MVDFDKVNRFIFVGDVAYLEKYLASKGYKSQKHYKQVLEKLPEDPSETICQEGLVSMASFLKQKGDFNLKSPQTCLKHSIENGHPKMLSYLLKTYPSQIDKKQIPFDIFALPEEDNHIKSKLVNNLLRMENDD